MHINGLPTVYTYMTYIMYPSIYIWTGEVDALCIIYTCIHPYIHSSIHSCIHTYIHSFIIHTYIHFLPSYVDSYILCINTKTYINSYRQTDMHAYGQ